MAFSEEKIRKIIEAGMPVRLVESKRILVLTLDATRTCPLMTMVRALGDTIGKRAAKLDFLVAVGTHPILSEEQILTLCGISKPCRREEFGRSDFFCHRWDLPDTLMQIGRLSEKEVVEISDGLLRETVSIEINRKIYDYDLILGPVFPHEVDGFSGGAKYLFPGISGGELLHFFHWLGAVITTRKIIGRKDTPDPTGDSSRNGEDQAAPLLPVDGGAPRRRLARSVLRRCANGLVRGCGFIVKHSHCDQTEILWDHTGPSA